MRWHIVAALFVVCFSATAQAATLTGWVSDESCGAVHIKPGQESCVEKCLRGGASVGHPEWLPQRMVLVSDDGETIWLIENPNALKSQAGRHVIIKATLHSRSNSIRVMGLQSQ